MSNQTTATQIREEAIAQSIAYLNEQHDLTDEERAEIQDGIDLLRSGAGEAQVRWTARNCYPSHRLVKVGWSAGIYVEGYGHIAIDANAEHVNLTDGRLNPYTIGQRFITRRVAPGYSVPVVCSEARGMPA